MRDARRLSVYVVIASPRIAMSARVIVIGGGFAGVAAAATLRATGVDVVVLDANAAIGGRARSDTLGNIVVDTGAQLVASSFARTLALLAAGDGAPRLVKTAGRDALVIDGEREPIQFGSMRSLLTFAGLSPLDKVRLGTQLLPLLAKHRDDLDADAERLPAELDAQSARSFVAANIGERAADMLVEIALNAFYAARGDDASLAFYLALARYGSDSDLLAASRGWSAALAFALRGATHTPSTRIATIEVSATGVRAACGDGRTWSADGAIIATGPRAARALLAPHLATDSELSAWLAGIPMRASWTAALAIRGALDHSAFGLFSDRDAGGAASAIAVHGAKLEPDAPRDADAVLAWGTPEIAERLALEPPEGVVAALLPDVERMLPDIRGRITRARVYRFDEGTPLPFPGFAADRRRGRALASSIAMPVALAGDYLTMPLIEGAVASGESAARLLLDKLGASSSAP
ncbi:MAG: FAD-dependent oxidoreductase [Gemmatimonadaceae bacterium]